MHGFNTGGLCFPIIFTCSILQYLSYVHLLRYLFFIYIFIDPSIYLSSFLLIYMHVSLFIYLSIYLSTYLIVCLSIYLYIYIYFCLFIYTSIYISFCLSVYLLDHHTMHLSTYLSTYLIFIINFIPFIFAMRHAPYIVSFLYVTGHPS